MIYHILNGDALAASFGDTKLEGEVIVFREALIDGDLGGNSLPEFWQTRAEYMQVEKNEYYASVVNEIEKILKAPENSEFNLWFEYDLFCQVNLWFLLSIIQNLGIEKKVFAVYSSFLDKSSTQFWNGFGRADTGELLQSFSERVYLNDDALRFGAQLWKAYKHGQNEALVQLAAKGNPAFPYLREVVDAQVERFPGAGKLGRPERVLSEILNNGITNNWEVFVEFWKRESLYGFGDNQLQKLFNSLTQNR